MDEPPRKKLASSGATSVGQFERRAFVFRRPGHDDHSAGPWGTRTPDGHRSLADLDFPSLVPRLCWGNPE